MPGRPPFHRALLTIAGLLIAAVVQAGQSEPPVAVEGHLTTAMERAAESTLAASDPDGDTLTFHIVTPPRKGTLVLVDAGKGSFVYTPAKFESGADLFTFQASDGTSTSAVTPFTIAIEEPRANVALRRHSRVTVPGQLADAPELVDGDLTTSWTSDPGMTGDLGIVVDLGESRRVWRVVIHWADGGHATAYEVRTTNRAMFRTLDGQGGSEDIRVAANWFVRYLVVGIKRLPHEAGRTFGIREVEVYATEALSHLHRNPPPAPADPLDATTFAALTDGDAATSVTGSFSPEPLQFFVSRDLPAPIPQRLVLLWGDAYASDYEISLLQTCTSLDSVELHQTAGAGGVEVIELPPDVVSYGCMRIRFLAGPGEFFDLREVELYGPLAKIAPLGSLASATESGAALDGNLFTEWVSPPSSGPAWFLIEVPSNLLSKLRIVWGDHAPRNYAVFVARNGDFEPYYATNAGDGGVDFIDNGFTSIRYVLVVTDPSDEGYSIREIEVFRARVTLP